MSPLTGRCCTSSPRGRTTSALGPCGAGADLVRGKAIPRRDLPDEVRFAVRETSVLLIRGRRREHVPSCNPIGRCDLGGQVFAVGLSAEHEVPRRFE